MNKQKLQIMVAVHEMPIYNANPWGDYDRILQITTRNQPGPDGPDGTIHQSLYFKVGKDGKRLNQMTGSEFKDACVVKATAGNLPYIVEL